MLFSVLVLTPARGLPACLPMDPVPEHAKNVTKHIPNRSCNENEDHRDPGAEWSYRVRRLEKVQPKDEIQDPLCPAHCHQHRPRYMPSTDQSPKCQPDLVWTNCTLSSLLPRAIPSALPRLCM